MVFRELKEKINKLTNLLMKSDDISKDKRLTQRPSFDIFFQERPGIRHPEITPSLPLLMYVHNNSPSIKVATMRLRETIFRRGFEWERKFEAKCKDCGEEYEDILNRCESCGSQDIDIPNKNELKRADDFFETCTIYDRYKAGKRKLIHLLKEIEDDINIYDDAYLIGIKEYWQDNEGDIKLTSLHQIVRGNPVTMRMVADEKGDPGGKWGTCCSDDTEILTTSGWKLFRDVTYDDEIATLNEKEDKLEYQNPTDIIVQEYNGNMIHISDTNKDILVTPDHQMYVKKGNKQNWEFKNASELLINRWRIKRNVNNYINDEKENFILPKYEVKYKNGNTNFIRIHCDEEKNIKMDDWLEFLGYYISEGCSSYKCVHIYQKKYPEKIEECLKRFPFEYKISIDKYGCKQFKIYSRQLAVYLKQFGLCNEKYISDELLQLSKRQLKILFDALILGDGSITNNRYDFYSYYTTSKKLADNIQEIMFKLGMFSVIKVRDNSKYSHQIGNRIIKSRYNLYEVVQYIYKIDGRIDEKNRSIIPYSGNVYCVTVPNGIIYVRRNNKPLWIGNCLRHRDIIEDIVDNNIDKLKCKKCNRKLFEVHYVSVEGGGDQPSAYYIGDEVIHVSKYHPSALYGFSPIVTLWQTALTLTNMTEYIYRAYSEAHLPKGVLAMKTSNPDSAYEFWKDVDDKLQKDKHYIPKMFLEGEGNGTGSGMEFVKFMDTLEEMQYIPVRDEIRRTIAALYGVTNIFIGDTSGVGGMNSESTQIDITNMAAESGISIYNDYIMPEILSWLGIKDWEYVLQSPFEENKQRELNENQSQVQIAQSMLQMGFDIQLGEEDIFEFKYSGEAKKQDQQSPFNMPQNNFGENPDQGEPKGNEEVTQNTPGMNENDLKMSIEKSRVYVKHPNEAPKGVKIERSSRGSYFYDKVDQKPIPPQRPNEATLSMDKKRRIETLLQQANEHYGNILEEYKHTKDLNPGHAMSLTTDLQETRNLISSLHRNYQELFNDQPKVEKESSGRNVNINIQKYAGEEEDIRQTKKFQAELMKIFNEEMSKIMTGSEKFAKIEIQNLINKVLNETIIKMTDYTRHHLGLSYREGQQYVAELVGKAINFQKIDESALKAITERKILFTSYKNMSNDLSKKLNEVVEESFRHPETHSIANMIKTMQESTSDDVFKLARIARTENHIASQTGRAISFEKIDPDNEYRYKWAVRHDARTSDVCKSIDTQVEQEGNGKGVTLSRLNDILKENVTKYHPNLEFRPWMVHPNCRSGLIRVVDV